jgi:hypothetical protein
MAVTRTDLSLPWAPLPADAAWPTPHPADVSLSYYPPADILYVHLLGTPQAGIVWPIEPADAPYAGLSVKVEEESNTVVDVLVEGYLTLAVRVHPDWLTLARLADVTDAAYEEHGLRCPQGTCDRDAAVAAFLRDVRASWDRAVRDEAGQAPTHG